MKPQRVDSGKVKDPSEPLVQVETTDGVFSLFALPNSGNWQLLFVPKPEGKRNGFNLWLEDIGAALSRMEIWKVFNELYPLCRSLSNMELNWANEGLEWISDTYPDKEAACHRFQYISTFHPLPGLIGPSHPLAKGAVWHERLYMAEEPLPLASIRHFDFVPVTVKAERAALAEWARQHWQLG